MKQKYQNIFFLFGISVLALMVAQLNFAEVWDGIQRAGYWFFAVIGIWIFLYMMNTAAWYIILRSTIRENQYEKQGENQGKNPGENQGKNNLKKVNFWWLYKITISGFAINYATPMGLMGGEPYRIMALSPKVGTECASASVILYAMTHIFSHFWFWLLSVVLFIATRSIDIPMALILSGTTAFCSLAIWFFMKGYKKGIAVSCMNIMSHIPFVKRWSKGFVERNAEQLTDIDSKMAALHNQNPRTFVSAVLFELGCRVLSALEIYFVLLVVMPDADYISCILILAFTSLFANMFFFIPLQLGGREGGFLLSAHGLALSASHGIFVALIIRIRELIWTAIGLLLIQIDKRKR